MSTLKVNTIENVTGNVTLSLQTIASTQQTSNAALAIALALGV